MLDNLNLANSYSFAPMKKSDKESFWLKARVWNSMSLDFEAQAHEVPLQWILGDEPVFNGKPIEVLQLMQIDKDGWYIAEVKYK